MTQTVSLRDKREKLVEAVQEKLKNLSELKDKPMRTNGYCPWNYSTGPHRGDKVTQGEFCNIHKDKSIHRLVKILSNILSDKEAYKQAANELGLKEFPVFTWAGYPYEDWLHDIKTRIEVINYEEKKNILMNAEKELDTLLSEEERKEKVISSIADALDLTM